MSNQTKSKNYFKENMIAMLVYVALFLIILIPFREIGWEKLCSVSLVLAFFASILNRFLVEYFEWKEKWLKKEEPSIKQNDPVGYENVSFGPRTLVDKDYNRPPGERGPISE